MWAFEWPRPLRRHTFTSGPAYYRSLACNVVRPFWPRPCSPGIASGGTICHNTNSLPPHKHDYHTVFLLILHRHRSPDSIDLIMWSTISFEVLLVILLLRSLAVCWLCISIRIEIQISSNNTREPSQEQENKKRKFARHLGKQPRHHLVHFRSGVRTFVHLMVQTEAIPQWWINK